MSELLKVTGLKAGYGTGTVLHGIDLRIDAGQSCVVLGKNGVGKTTLMHAICGFLQATSGAVEIGGTSVAGKSPFQIQRAGVGLVPQGRRIFAPLTVVQNLQVSRRSDSGWTEERVFDLFPRLYERRSNRGDQLSGGEQQMLAIGRALMGGPKVLLLDEPSDGLAPKVIELVAAAIKTMRSEGLTVLLVEQNLALALAIADTVHVMEKGLIVQSMDADDVRRNPSTLQDLLGIAAR